MNGWVLFAGVLGLVLGNQAMALEPRARLQHMTCAGIGQAVAAQGQGPLLLASYPQQPGQPAVPGVLQGVAFTYDNALASIALFACGNAPAARQIADALAYAIDHDPEYRDGRVRNAYAAGPLQAAPVRLPGYWSDERAAWSQDAYQVGSATGNQAWAALALLEAYRHSGEARYLQASRKVLDWARRTTFDKGPPAGFNGGIYGFAAAPQVQSWKSTEHNVDLAAAWASLARLGNDSEAGRQARIARGFVEAHWDAGQGRFLIGTLPDGRTPQTQQSGLDAQIWPLIAIADAPQQWLQALTFVERAHGFAQGYGFKQDPDGIWTEGTAQVAAVASLRGLAPLAQPLWPLLLAQQAGDGWLYATPQAQVSTGLSVGPDSTHDDFLYFHLPHLGATAWAAIAATGVNPFTGDYKAH